MQRDKERELLRLLEEDSRQSPERLAVLLGVPEAEVRDAIRRLEEENVIVKYPAIVNWDKLDEQPKVTAMIDVKVTPKRDVGFDEVAERLARFPEVKALYLMSGANYDLSVVVEARTMREVAAFVAQKLAPLESVVSTATHFLLKRYKHDGVLLEERESERRMVVTP